MGVLSILMAMVLLAGTAAALVLALTGSLAPAAAIWPVVATAGLWLCYRAVEPAARWARELRVRNARGPGRLAAALHGGVPASVIIGYQIATVRAPGLGSALHPIVLLAVMTAPATVLAWRAGRQRRTLWSARAYGAHLSGWALLTCIWLGLPLGVTATLMLLCHVIPATIGYLEALADPGVLRSVRM